MGNSYTTLWDFGDGYFSNGLQVVHAFSLNGVYEVQVTVSNGDFESTEVILITVDIPGLSIEELQDELVSETYTDLLGREASKNRMGEVIIRRRLYSSGKQIVDKMIQ